MALDSMPVLTLALGLGVAEGIARATDVACDLRWPNDVMLGEKKVAGILVQLLDGTAIAGIGINVNHAAFPDELTGEAASLRMAAGRALSREEVLAEVLKAIDSMVHMLAQGGKDGIFVQFARRSSYVSGKRVRVALPEGDITGTTAGLDPNGFLRVRRDNGQETLILAGGVRALSS
jgi:BirA family biotin operon repressor/biotin-[acetyl-CoA-carboxylase] ligase